MKKHYDLGGICGFEAEISYLELTAESPINVLKHHIHDECEIYINLSGDVSFAVENTFYPIVPGSVIITRPYEYHHCFYHSNKPHKHFWMLFQPSENTHLFDIFYKRELGENNLLVLEPQKNDELIDACRHLVDGTDNEIDGYFYFFKIIHLLNSAPSINTPKKFDEKSVILPAINHINANFSAKLSLNTLAEKCNVSVSTLERHFSAMFNLTPFEYIKKRRLANATKMLADGCGITDTAYACGFPDCSSFISSFKKEYGITPLQYRKKHIKNSLSH